MKLQSLKLQEARYEPPLIIEDWSLPGDWGLVVLQR